MSLLLPLCVIVCTKMNVGDEREGRERGTDEKNVNEREGEDEGDGEKGNNRTFSAVLVELSPLVHDTPHASLLLPLSPPLPLPPATKPINCMIAVTGKPTATRKFCHTGENPCCV